VFQCGCVFGIFIILHHIITSFRITSHHSSYRINNTRVEYVVDLRRMLRKNKNVLRHEVSFGEYSFISLVTKRRDPFLQSMDIFTKHEFVFFTKHEKKGRCFFAEGSKTVCMQSFMHRKEMNYNNLHFRFKAIHIKYYNLVTIKVQCPF
jgi:hypothetical protein